MKGAKRIDLVCRLSSIVSVNDKYDLEKSILMTKQ